MKKEFDNQARKLFIAKKNTILARLPSAGWADAQSN
jgi:hypothetical protein